MSRRKVIGFRKVEVSDVPLSGKFGWRLPEKKAANWIVAGNAIEELQSLLFSPYKRPLELWDLDLAALYVLDQRVDAPGIRRKAAVDVGSRLMGRPSICQMSAPHGIQFGSPHKA